MISKSTEARPGSAMPNKVDSIRAAIEVEIGPLCRAIATIVRSAEASLSRNCQAQRVTEVLNEVVCRALARPETYQPGRPVLPWLIGIAHNVVRSDARDAAVRPRRTTVDEATWEQVAGLIGPADGVASARIDAETMLGRLTPSARRALESRYWKGLDGEELAKALGARSVGAARLRVFRALQTLRDLFASGVTR